MDELMTYGSDEPIGFIDPTIKGSFIPTECLPEFCGRHHKLMRGQCCCGELWNSSMICHPCRVRAHGECTGGTWCNCQHQLVAVRGKTNAIV